MTTRYVVFCNGIRTVYDRDFDFVSKIVTLITDGIRDDKKMSYSLRGDEIEDDPEYDYRLIFKYEDE
jgi:hypothetical protein